MLDMIEGIGVFALKVIVACVAVMLLVSWVERYPRRQDSTTQAADSEPSALESREQQDRSTTRCSPTDTRR